MAQVIKELVTPQYLSNSTTTLATASASKLLLYAINLTNSSASTETFSLYLVPSAGSAGDSNVLIKNRGLLPNKTDSANECIGQVLEPGMTLQGVCSGSNAINISVSAVEIT